jgi:hypothetical protein
VVFLLTLFKIYNIMKIIFLKDSKNGQTGEPIKKGEVLDLGEERNKSAVERGLAEFVKEKVEKKVNKK